MDDIDYLQKKYTENKIKIVNLSKLISNTYIENSTDELKAAKIMLKSNLYSQSITHSYYSMYLSVQSLFFLCGIKCEDHNASIIILKEIFKIENITIKKAKDERIQVQYYRKSDINEKQALELIKNAENFIVIIKNFSNELSNNNIEDYRSRLKSLLEK